MPICKDHQTIFIPGQFYKLERLLQKQVQKICMQMDSKPTKTKHSSRIPDVFLHGMNKQKQKQRHNEAKQIEPEVKESKNNKQQNRGKRKSKNPLLPIQEWLKFSKLMDKKMDQVRQGIEMDKFSKLSFESNSNILKEEQRRLKTIKYEDCLTLTTLKKNQTGCLKKILHVSTLNLYYMRESVINLTIDKNDLEEWIKNCNEQLRKRNSRAAKIIQLYWNTPEGYYSIVYQYIEGTLLETMLDNLSTLPVSFIQKIIQVHLTQPFQVYNSLLLVENNSTENLHYLPLYGEMNDFIPSYRKFTDLLSLNIEEERDIEQMEKVMVARLGFLALTAYCGEILIDEDINSMIFIREKEECSLIHKLLDCESSLTKMFFQTNFEGKQEEKDLFIDFLGQCLKFQTKERITFDQLQIHPFLTFKCQKDPYTINQLTTLLQSGGQGSSATRQLSQHKMNKILDSMSLILQGIPEGYEVDLTPSNPNIDYLVKQFGLAVLSSEMKSARMELIKKLKKIYSQHE